jgi:tRNA uridine 5-carboxymethylaminomethyl modification enzyme
MLDPSFDWTSDAAQEVAEEALYAPYLERQDAELRDLRAGEALKLGVEFPYAAIPGLSNEMIERLSSVKPPTLAAAGRVPGITPAALAALLIHARRIEPVG